jgi:hypothetical protein
MRTLTFDDIRVSARDRNLIIAAPTWAYEPGVTDDRGRQRYRPIEAAWVLIDGEFEKRRAIAAEEQRRRIEAAEAIIADESIASDDRRKERAKNYLAGLARMRHWNQIRFATAKNCVSEPTPHMIHDCRLCGEAFFGYGRTQFCSARCYRTRRKETYVRSKQPRKPVKVEQEPRDCDYCYREFLPTRRDARFCSGRCRVAAHRAASAG